MCYCKCRDLSCTFINLDKCLMHFFKSQIIYFSRLINSLKIQHINRAQMSFTRPEIVQITFTRLWPTMLGSREFTAWPGGPGQHVTAWAQRCLGLGTWRRVVNRYSNVNTNRVAIDNKWLACAAAARGRRGQAELVQSDLKSMPCFSRVYICYIFI